MNFVKTIYKEHLEEISALYAKRAGFTADKGIRFQDVTNIEERLEAHIDALICGGEKALEICNEQDDFGEVFGAVSVFCRQNQIDSVKQILLKFENINGKQNKALAEALLLYMPEQWHNDSEISVFVKNLESQNKTIPEIIKIGLDGIPDKIPALIEKLSLAESAEQAAFALNLIAGADLFEEVFIPDEIDKDMLFDDELEKLKKGEPLYPPGKEPGINITRLSQNPKSWQTFWEDNKNRFDPNSRYRNGELYCPACLVENLKSKIYPNYIRKLVYQELVFNYNIDVPFDTSMLVKEQLNAINELEIIIKGTKDKFESGKWYVNGKLKQSNGEI